MSAIEYEVERAPLPNGTFEAAVQTDEDIRFPRERLHVPVHPSTLPDDAKFAPEEKDHPDFYPDRVQARQVKWINTMLYPPPKLPRTEKDCNKLLTQWQPAKQHLPPEMHNRFDKLVRNLYYRRLVAVRPHDIGRCGLVRVHYDMTPGSGAVRVPQRRIAPEKT